MTNSEAMVRTVNMYEAKTHLSRLVDRAAKGEPFIIAKAGKPLVKVVPLETPEAGQARRVGVIGGAVAGPGDFVRVGGGGIGALFCLKPGKFLLVTQLLFG